MLTEQQNAKLNDLRATLTQGIDTLKSGETMIADAQTKLQALQLEIGVQAPVSTTPSADGTYSKEQYDQAFAKGKEEGMAEAVAADKTPFSAEDVAKIEAAKNEIISALEAKVAELEAVQPTPGAPVEGEDPATEDQDAAQEALADKMSELVQMLRDLTPSKIASPAQPEA